MFLCDWNVIFSLCLDTYIASEMTIRMINNELISNSHLCCCYYLSDKEAQAWRRASSLPLSREHCYVSYRWDIFTTQTDNSSFLALVPSKRLLRAYQKPRLGIQQLSEL
jgi:hypothetical protein